MLALCFIKIDLNRILSVVAVDQQSGPGRVSIFWRHISHSLRLMDVFGVSRIVTLGPWFKLFRVDLTSRNLVYNV